MLTYGVNSSLFFLKNGGDKFPIFIYMAMGNFKPAIFEKFLTAGNGEK